MGISNSKTNIKGPYKTVHQLIINRTFIKFLTDQSEKALTLLSSPYRYFVTDRIKLSMNLVINVWMQM